MKQGYVHVYTGDGKGKTTAAMGLALRAAGNSMNIFIAQFAKGQDTGEIKAIENIPNITIKQYGIEKFITGSPVNEVIKNTRQGFFEASEIIMSGKYDLVILDEVNIALFYKILTLDEVLEIIDTKPKHTELVLTGRKAASEIIARADLVTEMKNIKHYYDAGVSARRGIEY